MSEIERRLGPKKILQHWDLNAPAKTVCYKFCIFNCCIHVEYQTDQKKRREKKRGVRYVTMAVTKSNILLANDSNQN